MDFRQDPSFNSVVDHLEQTRGLPPGILRQLVGAESSGNPNAVSPVGARGITQFMPATAQQYNVDVTDPVDSLRGTADYLQDLTHKYGGNVRAAVAHYNGGAHNAQYQVDGTEPSPQQVSPQNAQVNKAYVNQIMGGVQQAPTQQDQAQPTDMVGQINSFVTDLAKNGASADVILNQLLRNPTTADLVKQGHDEGQTPEQIVALLGGKDYAPIAAARSKVDQQGFVTNLGHGIQSGAGDMVEGGKQLIARATGDDAHLKQLQAQEQAHQQDPTQQAESDTWGGMIGSGGVKALPYVGAAMIPGGQSIVGQALAGAVGGALTPTTGDGQILPNMATDAALGAAIPAGGVLAKSVGKALSGSMPEARALMSGRALTNHEAAGMKDISKMMLEKVGITGKDVINPGDVKQAVEQAYAKVDPLLADIKVPTDTSLFGFSNKLDDVINYLANHALDGGDGKILEDIDALKARVSEGINGTQLVDFRKFLANKAFDAKGVEHKALLDLTKVIDDHLAQVAPEVSNAYNTANEVFHHGQALNKIVGQTLGQGEKLTATSLARAIKQTNPTAFANGTAPFQDIADAALKAYGPVEGGIASDTLQHAIHSNNILLTGASLLHPMGIPILAGRHAVSKIADMLAAGKAKTFQDFLPASQAAGLGRPSPSIVGKALADVNPLPVIDKTPPPPPTGPVPPAVPPAGPVAPVLQASVKAPVEKIVEALKTEAPTVAATPVEHIVTVKHEIAPAVAEALKTPATETAPLKVAGREKVAKIGEALAKAAERDVLQEETKKSLSNAMDAAKKASVGKALEAPKTAPSAESAIDKIRARSKQKLIDGIEANIAKNKAAKTASAQSVKDEALAVFQEEANNVDAFPPSKKKSWTNINNQEAEIANAKWAWNRLNKAHQEALGQDFYDKLINP